MCVVMWILISLIICLEIIDRLCNVLYYIIGYLKFFYRRKNVWYFICKNYLIIEIKIRCMWFNIDC